MKAIAEVWNTSAALKSFYEDRVTMENKATDALRKKLNDMWQDIQNIRFGRMHLINAHQALNMNQIRNREISVRRSTTAQARTPPGLSAGKV